MKKIVSILFSIAILTVVVGIGFAEEAAQVTEAARSLGDGLLGVGAGLAIGLAAIGVGIAQGYIGSAGLGLLAERPGAFGQVLIYLVIPETLIIFGFVIAFFLQGKIVG
jgi:V/A-type H+-transporting ATPase subunit K